MHRVVVGALVRDGRVLLVHRRPDKRAYPDVWDLPGGHLEDGESELGALTRELHEELGVQIAIGSASRLCRTTAGPADEPALLSAWLVRDWHGTPSNVAPEEHDDIGWFSLEQLPPLAHVVVRTAVSDAVGGRPGRVSAEPGTDAGAGRPRQRPCSESALGRAGRKFRPR